MIAFEQGIFHYPDYSYSLDTIISNRRTIHSTRQPPIQFTMVQPLQILWRFNLAVLHLMETVYGLRCVRFDRMKISICAKYSKYAFVKWLWLLAVVLALCLSSYAFYVWYCVKPISRKYRKQWITIIIVWYLNILVAVVIYWQQFIGSERIYQLNRKFIRLAEEHM